ncbi:MAG TPA: exodeoxyribonuclease VII small subunit [Polyangiaceae bacterium]|nr:exodeoxyribonuclease VII small subunit [Polyangiaceae bacterium]
MTGDTKKKRSKAADDSSFEGSLRRLTHIVDQLEEGELPLEESLKLFEEGVGLARKSQATLDAAEKRVEQLLSVDGDGKPVTQELDEES